MSTNAAAPIPEPQLFPGPRIERVTLGRLHNLGNYEHIRYEITLHIPEGTSPASVMAECEDLLNSLEPRAPVNVSTVLTARRRLQQPAKEGDEADAAERKRATDTIASYQAWLDQRDQALARFNQFGGLSRTGSAKWAGDRE